MVFEEVSNQYVPSTGFPSGADDFGSNAPKSRSERTTYALELTPNKL